MSSLNCSATGGKSFLIVCFRFVGDVFVTTPLALSIRTAHPDAVVDYLVFQGTEKVLVKNPNIRKVITVPRDKSGIGVLLSLFKKYDVAIAAYPSDRTVVAAAIAGKRSLGMTNGFRKEWWKHLALDNHYVCYDYMHAVSNMLMPLRMMEIDPVPRAVMGYDENDTVFARNNIKADRYIILHPYSMKEYKYWPAENWGRLVTLIQEQTNCTAIFTRTPEPEGSAVLEQILSSAPPETMAFDAPCSLNQLAAIINASTAFIGIDTAITHIAAALDVPTIAIFGPTLTRYWAPWPNDCADLSPFAANRGIQNEGCVTVVQKDWECVPCNKETCRISSRNRIECLEAITPEEVFREVLDNVKRHHQK